MLSGKEYAEWIEQVKQIEREQKQEENEDRAKVLNEFAEATKDNDLGPLTMWNTDRLRSAMRERTSDNNKDNGNEASTTSSRNPTASEGGGIVDKEGPSSAYSRPGEIAKDKFKSKKRSDGDNDNNTQGYLNKSNEEHNGNSNAVGMEEQQGKKRKKKYWRPSPEDMRKRKLMENQ